MWLAAVTVVVVVAAGEADDPSTPAIEQALRTALGADASIAVRTSDDVETPGGDGAPLVGVVTWSDRQRRVTIHFTNPRDGRSSDREIRFDASDAPAERGRAVGFALASMVPAEELVRPGEPRPTNVAPAPPAPQSPIPTSTPPATPSETSVAPPRANGLALDATAVATTAVGGYGGGLGGTFAFRVPLLGAVGARVALGARGGEVRPAQATSRVFVGAVGLTWQPWLDSRRRWAAGARVDALVLNHQLSHFSDDDPESVPLSRFVPGFDAAIEAAFRFSDRALLVAAVGPEVALGKTEIIVRGREVATLSPVRIFGEMGVRVSF